MKSKLFLYALFVLVIGSLSIFCNTASADSTGVISGPFQTPTYIPTNVLTPITLPSGAQNITLSVAGKSTVAFKFNGTCTGLAGTVQGSTDNGSTWTTINVYPYPALGTAAPTAAVSGAIAGGTLEKLNTQGFSHIKFVLSALSANNTCSLTAAETTGGFNGSVF